MAGAKNTTRRDFLRKTARVAAGAIVFPFIIRPSALAKAGSVAPHNRITAGFVGAGGRGHWNLRAFMTEPDVEVVAVCDVDARHRESAGQKASLGPDRTYNDFRSLLARPDIDVVVISTPDHWHVPIAIAAAKAGKDIYCEKPLSLTVAEGRELCDVVKSYRRVFQTGSQQRSDRKFQVACELVRTGRIGELQNVKVGLPGSRSIGPQPVMPVPKGFDYDMWLGPAPWKPYTQARCHGKFRHIFDYSGGKFIDWGAHHLDIVQLALGAEDSGPVEISGWGEFPREGIYDTAVKYDIDYVYANGVRVNASTQNPGVIRFEGTEGWVLVNRGIIDAHPRSLLSVCNFSKSGMATHVRNFLDCVKVRVDPVAPVESGHRSATLCHLGNIAMLLGRTMHWDPASEHFIDEPAADRMLTRSRRRWQRV